MGAPRIGMSTVQVIVSISGGNSSGTIPSTRMMLRAGRSARVVRKP